MMRGIATFALIAGLTLTAQSAAAESWSRFSATDRIAYLVDLDQLNAVDGVVAARFARVPSQGDAADQSHEIEEVSIRCSDGQSRTTTNVTFGADGAETDRYSEETPWEATPAGGIYGALKSFACDSMRPRGDTWPTIAAFIAAGRGG
jgi:hypothetical protein